jgi:hypothetical protein
MAARGLDYTSRRPDRSTLKIIADALSGAEYRRAAQLKFSQCRETSSAFGKVFPAEHQMHWRRAMILLIR